MRIVHVISSLDPEAGGPPMIAARLAAGQAMLGHEVALATYDWPGRQSDTLRAHETMPAWSDLNVVMIPAPTGRLDRLLASSATAPLEALIRAADFVHLHSLWQPLLVRASRLCAQYDKPYMVLLNGTLDPWSLKQARLKKKFALAIAFRKMLNGAAALHLGNRDEQQLIEPLNLQTPGVIIPNGIFFEEIEPLPEAGSFYAKHPELGGAPFVLFLSRLHYKKGPEFLVDAFADIASKHPEVHVVIAGPDGGSLAGLEQQVREHQLESRIHLVGPLYGEDKYAALVDAQCFCLPSWQEGFSVAIIEAMACAKPVVITEGCHFPEVAEVGAGEVVSLSRANVAEALDRVLSDASLRQSMSKAGRELIASRCTWPKIAEQTIGVYEDLLGAAS